MICSKTIVKHNPLKLIDEVSLVASVLIEYKSKSPFLGGIFCLEIAWQDNELLPSKLNLQRSKTRNLV
jgi:hypothetical protein